MHQLRVGLRRLTTALRAFGEAAPDLVDCEIPIAEVFRALGRWRDTGVTEESIVPRLRDAGAPAVTLPETTEERLSPTTIVRGTALQVALLRLMEFAMVDQPASDDSRVTSANGNDLASLIDERLSKLQKGLRRRWPPFREVASGGAAARAQAIEAAAVSGCPKASAWVPAPPLAWPSGTRTPSARPRLGTQGCVRLCRCESVGGLRERSLIRRPELRRIRDLESRSQPYPR